MSIPEMTRSMLMAIVLFPSISLSQDSFIDLDWRLADPIDVTVNNETGELHPVNNNGGGNGFAAQPESGATNTLMISYRTNITVTQDAPRLRDVDNAAEFIRDLVQIGIETAFGAHELATPPSVSATITITNASFYTTDILLFVELNTTEDAVALRTEFSVHATFESAFRTILNIAILAGLEGRTATFSHFSLEIDYIESVQDRVAGQPFFGHSGKSSSPKSKKHSVKKGKYTAPEDSQHNQQPTHQGSRMVFFGVLMYGLMVSAVVVMMRLRNSDRVQYDRLEDTSIM